MRKKLVALLLVCACLLMPVFSMQASAKSQYTSYVNARTLQSGLNLQPTAIFEPSNFADIPTSSLANTNGITSILLTPDSKMDITLGGETKAFTELFDSKIKGLFIPVLYLTAQTVDGFISMMNNTYYIKDIMVVSNDLNVHKKIYEDEVATICNRVYDITDVTLTTNRYQTWEHIGESNKYYVNTLMLDGSDPNLYVASEYISAMGKVCWAYCANQTQTINAISVGATGVVINSVADFKDSIKYFSKKGWAKAQSVAAHRGITAYANENSLTAVAAAVSEGATHAEIDIQVTADKRILVCHNNSTNETSKPSNGAFSQGNSSALRTLKLNDYSAKYGDTFPTLEEIIDVVSKTDLILIIELKLADGHTSAVKKEAIKTFLSVMEKYPEMDGKWYCITFFRPYAVDMRELAPQIPVGFLGGGSTQYETSQGIKPWDGEWTHMSNVQSKIAFLHKFNVILDEGVDSSPQNYAQTYLARGYTLNSWTFKNPSHFNTNYNVATTDAAEQVAMAIKEIKPTTLKMTSDQLSSGKITVSTVNYCGWVEDRECDIILVKNNGTTAQVLLHYTQTLGDYSYGLYSQLLTYDII